MNTETILLIISLFSNAVIILKKIKVIWTPCLIIQCQNDSQAEGNSNENSSSETNTQALRIKRYLTTKFTPRRIQQQKREEVKPEDQV